MPRRRPSTRRSPPKRPRFLHHGVDDPTPEQSWRIPVTLRFATGEQIATRKVMLSSRSQVIDLGTGRTPDWIHPNAGEVAYYRWQVEPPILRRLAEGAVAHLSGRERVGLVDHLSAMLDAGVLRGDQYLGTLAAFANDPEPEVIDALSTALGGVEAAFVTEELEKPFARYVRRVLRPALERFGMERREGEDEVVSTVRHGLIAWLGDTGEDPGVQRHADDLARAYLDDPTAVDPSLAGTALALAAMRGDRSMFDLYRERFENAEVPADRRRFLGALGSFREPELVDAALRYALEGPLRPQELWTIPWRIGSTPAFENRPDEWMTANHDVLAARLPPMFLA